MCCPMNLGLPPLIHWKQPLVELNHVVVLVLIAEAEFKKYTSAIFAIIGSDNGLPPAGQILELILVYRQQHPRVQN